MLYSIDGAAVDNHHCWIGFGSNRMIFIPIKDERPSTRDSVAWIFGVYEVTHVVEISPITLDLSDRGETTCTGVYFWNPDELSIYAIDGDRLLKIDLDQYRVYDTIPDVGGATGLMERKDPVEVYRDCQVRLRGLGGWAKSVSKGMEEFFERLSW